MTNGRVRRRAALSSSLLRHIASTRINHDLSNRAGEAEGQDVIRTDGRALIPTDLGVFHPGGRNCSIQMLGTCRHIVHRQGENSPARPLSRLPASLHAPVERQRVRSIPYVSQPQRALV